MADKWKVIETEMNRFEEEISSLGSGSGGGNMPSSSKPGGYFIPSSVVRRAATTANTSRPSVSSTPVVISGAPQVYNSAAVLSKGPVKSSNSVNTSSISNTSTLLPQSVQIPVSKSVRPSLIPGAPKITTTVGTRLLPTPTTTSTFDSMEVDVKPEKDLLHPTSQVKTEPSAGTSSSGGTNKTKKKKKKTDESAGGGAEKEKKPRKHVRCAGGTVWEDPTLLDWDPADFRLFCGDLGNDVTDEVLARVFGRYASFTKAKVVRDKRTNKTKGYGFVSFKDPNDFVRAIRELDGRYVGSRPIKLRKSNWKSRSLNQVRKREKEFKQLMGPKKALI